MSRFNPTSMLRKLRTCAAAAVACLAGGIPPAQATFDPVNDDTDIFLANPNVPAQRPNVMIYVDNTANWNTAFANEKTALASVFNSLTSDFNVGMMMYTETGAGNSGNDGGYIRFAVRQMTSTNRAVLAGIVSAFNLSGDRSNSNKAGKAMMEVERYYAGAVSYASWGKAKNDFANNTTHPATVANLGNYGMNANTSSTLFNSPTVDGCQSNFVINIVNTASANPQPSESSNDEGVSEDALRDLGYDVETPVPLTFTGGGGGTLPGNWADEWADYMANSDIDADDTNGTQHVFSYVVEVDPKTSSNGQDNTIFWNSVATQGKGKYFGVSSGNAGQAIINALNQIFQEVQAVNSVFASTTLPVSVNVRGTNLNQVYIGVFRPDSEKSPRWFGNLKMYKLGVSGGKLFRRTPPATRPKTLRAGSSIPRRPVSGPQRPRSGHTGPLNRMAPAASRICRMVTSWRRVAPPSNNASPSPTSITPRAEPARPRAICIPAPRAAPIPVSPAMPCPIPSSTPPMTALPRPVCNWA